jgi:LytS/YehU family sensor histidine kinase
MNPHFIYNVLNTVQGLLYDNRKTEVGNLLGNFSDLMRKTLQASDQQLQSLREEIENISLYLELEKARFDKDFEYVIEVNLIDDPSDLIIPSMLLQPFAENAVKHGLMHKSGKKLLNIKFVQTEDGLNVYVEDNGIGRKHSMQINQRNKNKPQSFATKAIAERIELFNRLYKLKITQKVVDKYDNQNNPMGTSIHLFIPKYEKENINL